jgi:hypothetical protein
MNDKYTQPVFEKGDGEYVCDLFDKTLNRVKNNTDII